MPREQRPTIKVNHYIEIWSPVNFHALSNKNTGLPGRQQQVENSWSDSTVSFVTLLKQMDEVFCFSPPWQIRVDFKKQTWLQTLWETLPIHRCSLLTQSRQHWCLIIRKQEEHYWWTTGVFTLKRGCVETARQQRHAWVVLLWNKC